MGENGTGKTTFINLLVEKLDGFSYSYKEATLGREYSKISLLYNNY